MAKEMAEARIRKMSNDRNKKRAPAKKDSLHLPTGSCTNANSPMSRTRQSASSKREFSEPGSPSPRRVFES